MQVCAGELGHPKLLDWRLSDIWPILNVLQKLELSRDSFPQLHAQRKGDEVGGVGERKARRHLHRHTHTHTHTHTLSLSLSLKPCPSQQRFQALGGRSCAAGLVQAAGALLFSWSCCPVFHSISCLTRFFGAGSESKREIFKRRQRHNKRVACHAPPKTNQHSTQPQHTAQAKRAGSQE